MSTRRSRDKGMSVAPSGAALIVLPMAGYSVCLAATKRGMYATYM